MTDEYFDPRAVALNHAQGADHADPVALAMVYVGTISSARSSTCSSSST